MSDHEWLQVRELQIELANIRQQHADLRKELDKAAARFNGIRCDLQSEKLRTSTDRFAYAEGYVASCEHDARAALTQPQRRILQTGETGRSYWYGDECTITEGESLAEFVVVEATR